MLSILSLSVKCVFICPETWNQMEICDKRNAFIFKSDVYFNGPDNIINATNKSERMVFVFFSSIIGDVDAH